LGLAGLGAYIAAVIYVESIAKTFEILLAIFIPYVILVVIMVIILQKKKNPVAPYLEELNVSYRKRGIHWALKVDEELGETYVCLSLSLSLCLCLRRICVYV
jgi:hypothetical protein